MLSQYKTIVSFATLTQIENIKSPSNQKCKIFEVIYLDKALQKFNWNQAKNMSNLDSKTSQSKSFCYGFYYVI